MSMLLAISIFLPLLAGVTGVLSPTRSTKKMQGASAGILLALTLSLLTHPRATWSYRFLHVGQLDLSLHLAASPISTWMAIVTAAINLMAQVYSIGYFNHVPVRSHTFPAILSGFTGAMLFTVFGSNLFTQFLGWELMGVGSYLLVGYFKTRHAARFAASQSFLVTRIGDLAFIIAVASGLPSHNGSLPAINHFASPWVAWGLIIAVLAKSAQGPFAPWLLDAMAGPTPASALIHAATMVAAGPFLLIRYFPLLSHTPGTLTTLAIVGGATGVMGGLGAMGTQEIKRLLAYSTVSQLGLMLLAIGLGSPLTAWILLVAHAGYKSLLFFLSGIASERRLASKIGDLSGGLTLMEILLLVVGTLGVSGLPPTGGFIAKSLLSQAASPHPAYWMLDALTAFLGGAYGARLFWALKGPRHPHNQNTSYWMTIPPVLLAAFVLINTVWQPLHAGSLPNFSALAIDLTIILCGAISGLFLAANFELITGRGWLLAWHIASRSLEGIAQADEWDNQAVRLAIHTTKTFSHSVRWVASGRTQWYVAVSSALLVTFIVIITTH